MQEPLARRPLILGHAIIRTLGEQFLSQYQAQLETLRKEVHGLLSSWKQVRAHMQMPSTGTHGD